MKKLIFILILVMVLVVAVQPVAAACGNCNPPPPGSVIISQNVACVPVADGHYFYIQTHIGVRTTPTIHGSCP